MKNRFVLLVCLALDVLPSAAFAQTSPTRQVAPASTATVQRGRALYESRCTACHAVDSNRTGPAHRGVVGRRAGSAADYAYSDELASSSVIWTPKRLNEWLADPEKVIPGQRMGFQIDSRRERADLIAYLQTLK